MTCIFFGHANTPEIIKNKLISVIIQLIEEEGVKNFYVGNNGSFDFFVQSILEEITKQRKDIYYGIVLSSIDERALNNCQNATVFPEGLEKSLPRFAISKRNDWLIKHADLVIAYTKNQISNSYKWLQKAKKMGLAIINLADTDIAF